MSKWEKRIEGHRVHTVLQVVSAAVDDLDERLPDDQSVADSVNRLHEGLAYIGATLQFADPSLSFPASLDNMANHLTEVQNQIAQWASNNNAQHLDNANVQLDNALLHLGGVRVHRPSEENAERLQEG